MPNYEIEAYGKKYTVESAKPLSDSDILGYVQKVQRPESFTNEVMRTRREQMESSDIRKLDFSKPGDAIMRILQSPNYPLAFSGIGPAMDVAAKRFIIDPLKQVTRINVPERVQKDYPITGKAANVANAISGVLAETAGLGAESVLPGAIAEVPFSALAKRLPKAIKSEQAAQKARDIIENRFPRAEAAGEELEKAGLKTARGLRAGEAKLEQFPEKISPQKMTPYEVGAEYRGTSRQPKPKPEELGLYGEKAQAASEHFAERYNVVKSKLADVKVTTQDVDEIKQGVFEGMRERTDVPEEVAAYRPRPTDRPFEGVPEGYFPKPKVLRREPGSLTQQQPFGKVTTVRPDIPGIGSLSPGWIPREPNPTPLVVEGKTYKSLEEFMEQALAENKALSGKQILERVQVLRDQARRSGSDLTEHLRNSLAESYMNKLNGVLERSGQTETANELQALNADYRKSRELFGRGAIPRLTARQFASDVLNAMFGGGRKKVERAQAMRDFLPKEKFDAYVRSFHESVFDPNEMKETVKLWNDEKRMPTEVKTEMYGERAKDMDRIIKGYQTDSKHLEQIERAGKNIDKYRNNLKSSLIQNARAAGYNVSETEAGYMLEKVHRGRGARLGGFGTYLGYEHLGLGMLNLSRGMVGPAMYQIAKGLIYLSPGFLPEATTTARGAKVIADVLGAKSTQQAAAAGWAFRTWLSKNGSSLKNEMQKVGITRTPKADVLNASPEIQDPAQR